MLEKLLSLGRKIIPKKLFKASQPLYHYALALTGALIYRFPSKQIRVIGITGTKGKTTTAELVNVIFESAGEKTAVLSTLHFKIGENDRKNLYKMTMPGRFFVQKFLREAVNAGCTTAVIEMTSEGAKQYRHKFINLDALIFTNLAPEHIESHGSYENYLNAKFSIAKELENKKKKPMKKVWLREATRGLFEEVSFLDPVIIVNKDDKEGDKFLSLNIKNKIPYSIKDAFNIQTDEKGSSFQTGKTVIHLNLLGIFNVLNALGAIACARYFSISEKNIKKGLESLNNVRGRVEKIETGEDYEVIVDYAHTPDSLKALYETFIDKKIIGVLGNTGGGRDKWKRPEMGKIADRYCSEIILTNEDPYDEDPLTIIEEVKAGIKNKPVEVILDRRLAIRSAIKRARTGNVILITGKGTDPYIMEAHGKKTPWDDAAVVREELGKMYA